MPVPLDPDKTRKTPFHPPADLATLTPAQVDALHRWLLGERDRAFNHLQYVRRQLERVRDFRLGRA